MKQATRIKQDDTPSLRFLIGELFTPSAPVRLSELFAGRHNQIMQLVDAVAEPGRHAVVYGERGVGKTSIAQVLEYLIPTQNRRPIYIRKPCDPSDTFSTIWRKVFKDIRFEIKEEDQVNQHTVDELYPAEISSDDVVREMKQFRRIDVPIIVIDEFNEISDQDVSIMIANTIKAISDDAVSCTIVVVGVADDVDQLFSDHKSIDRCCEQVRMPRMSREELGEIIDKRLPQLSMTIEPDARWKIIILSRGLPTYVHRLGKLAALNAVEELRRHITESDVTRAIEQMLTGSLQSLKHKYDNATHSNQPENLFEEVLLACALSSADEAGFFAPASVRKPLSEIVARPMQIAQFQNHLGAFITEKRGEILQRTGDERAYRFRFRDPAMQPYVIMKGIAEKRIESNAAAIMSFPGQPDLFAT